jgi:hypothetical protein
VTGRAGAQPPAAWKPGPLEGPALGYEDETAIEPCEKHGDQEVMGYWSGPGFTGAPIWWWLMRCGCVGIDASEDTIEAVR